MYVPVTGTVECDGFGAGGVDVRGCSVRVSVPRVCPCTGTTRARVPGVFLPVRHAIHTVPVPVPARTCVVGFGWL